MSEEAPIDEPRGEIVVYETPDGSARVEVIVGDETVWLTQAQMVDLFGRGQSVVARHIGNVFSEGELRPEGSMQILHRTSYGGRPATFYNLDVIISVGYRVKSKRGTQFRIWATNVLRDHLMRGWTLNEKRLLARGVEFDQAVALLTTTLRNQQFVTAEGQAVLEVVQHYARTWRMTKPRAERGRYARLLADGYIVEVAPSEKTTKKAAHPSAPRPLTSGH